MTLLLIVVIIALVVSFSKKSDMMAKEELHKKNTKTNITLQKVFFCDAYKLITESFDRQYSYHSKHEDATWCGIPCHYCDDDLLFEMVKASFDSSWNKLPYIKTEDQERRNKSDYREAVFRYRYIVNDDIHDRVMAEIKGLPDPTKKYLDDSKYYTEVSYLERIFLRKYIPKDISKIFFGAPNTKIPAPKEMREQLGIPLDLEQGSIYRAKFYDLEYDEYGELTGLFTNPLSNLIYQYCRLTTTRKLKELGFVYSYNNKESRWQENEREIAEFKELKEKYPWYFN